MAGFAILFVTAGVAMATVPMTVAASDYDFASIQDQFHTPRNRKTLRRSLSEQEQQQQRSIVAIVEQTIALGTFEKALKESVQILNALTDTTTALEDAATITTVFMPWNQAFDTLPDGFLQKLMQKEWILHRQDLLLYHIHIGSSSLSLFSSDAVELSTAATATTTAASSTATTTTILSMANGEIIALNRNNDGNGMQFESTANIVAYEEASNGYAYIIDKVLAPSFMSNTIMDILSSSSTTTSTFTSLIVTAGLEDLLSHSRAAFTVFSPSNEAFAELGEGTLAFLQSSESAEMLQQIITYHIVSGVYASVNMIAQKEDGSSNNNNNKVALILQSLLNGSNLSIETNHDNDVVLTVDGVMMIKPDVLAMNGIVHVISKVLTPPSMLLTTKTTTSTSGGPPPV